MRWKALAEIYTMHSFAPVSNLKIFVKICICFGKIYQIFADIAGVPQPGCYFLAPRLGIIDQPMREVLINLKY